MYPGPIGAILGPQLRGIETELDKSLPYASSLCGACGDVLPGADPIPDILVHNALQGRPDQACAQCLSRRDRVGAWALADYRNLQFLERFSTMAGRMFSSRSHLGPLPWPASPWTNARDLPVPAQESSASGGRRTMRTVRNERA